MKLHIGMRKIKSVIAVLLSFVIWQVIRCVFPQLDVHPLYAYIYSVIEMRETVVKTREFGKLRIKATFIGLVIGLSFIALTTLLTQNISREILKSVVEIGLIMVAVLCSITTAEVSKCKNFCGIAAIITVICMVSHNDQNRYFYAIMRVFQTLIGVFSAFVINKIIVRRNLENN